MGFTTEIAALFNLKGQRGRGAALSLAIATAIAVLAFIVSQRTLSLSNDDNDNATNRIVYPNNDRQFGNQTDHTDDVVRHQYHHLRQHICHNRRLVHNLQFQQIKRAKESFSTVGIDESEGAEVKKSSVQDVYLAPRGATDVQLLPNQKGYRVAVHYHTDLGKLMDVFIRKMLVLVVSSSETLYCHPERCTSSLVNSLEHEDYRKSSLPVQDSTFSFTFVRHPITRFISAVTEVEHRMRLYDLQHQDDDDVQKKSEILQFKFPLGDPFRFMEFLKMAIFMIGRAPIIKAMGFIQIYHTMPMIGPLLAVRAACRRELQLEATKSTSGNSGQCLTMPRLYRLESFSTEWERMAFDSGYQRTIQSAPQTFRRLMQSMVSHKSSSDPHKTTLAAQSFLSYANQDIVDLMSHKNSDFLSTRTARPSYLDSVDYQNTAKLYLRSICRVYFVDFVCTNYALPQDCRNITDDVAPQLPRLRWEPHSNSEGNGAWTGSENLCYNLSVVAAVQSTQLQHAHFEIFQNATTAFRELKTDHLFEFYNYSYGLLEATLPSDNQRYRKLVYHRILKAGNDVTRSLLYYSMIAHKNLNDTRNALDYCLYGTCKHPRLNDLTPKALMSSYPAARDQQARFSFLFVMEPMRKLASILLHHRGEENEARNIANRGKDVVREIEATVESLLSAFEAKTFVTRGVPEWRPVIGSLLLAQEKAASNPTPSKSHNQLGQPQQKAVYIYDSERLTEEWQRLRSDSSLDSSIADSFDLVMTEKPYFQRLLNHHNYHQKHSDLKKRTVNSLSTTIVDDVINQLSGKHRIAICRMYLTDYLCSGFRLPSDCEAAALLDDAQEAVKEYHRDVPQQRRGNRGSGWGLGWSLTAGKLLMTGIRTVVPRDWLIAMSAPCCAVVATLARKFRLVEAQQSTISTTECLEYVVYNAAGWVSTADRAGEDDARGDLEEEL